MISERANVGRAPIVIELIGGALAIFGLLWIICFFVSGGNNPVAGAATGNLIAGLALLATGALMVLRGEVLRRRRHPERQRGE